MSGDDKKPNLDSYTDAKASELLVDLVERASSGGFSLRPFAEPTEPTKGTMVSLPTSGLARPAHRHFSGDGSDSREAIISRARPGRRWPHRLKRTRARRVLFSEARGLRLPQGAALP
jgi:hypothetical protein